MLMEEWAVADPGFAWGPPTSKVGVLTYFLAENCMEMKEFGPGGGGRWCSPLDPPMMGTIEFVQ